MEDALWVVQLVGGVLMIILTSGALLAGLYTSVRETPVFFRRLTGVKSLEDKFDRLHRDHIISQQLQLQQAESFNELSRIVQEHHEIPEVERNTMMDTEAIREELMGRDETDFTRGD